MSHFIKKAGREIFKISEGELTIQQEKANDNPSKKKDGVDVGPQTPLAWHFSALRCYY